MTPSSLAHVEAVLRTLREAGFRADDALGALQVLVAYVVGHAVASYAPAKADEDSRPAYDRLREDEYPHVLEAVRLLPAHDKEKEFELGLDALLIGLDQRRRAKRR